MLRKSDKMQCIIGRKNFMNLLKYNCGICEKENQNIKIIGVGKSNKNVDIKS